MPCDCSDCSNEAAKLVELRDFSDYGMLPQDGQPAPYSFTWNAQVKSENGVPASQRAELLSFEEQRDAIYILSDLRNVDYYAESWPVTVLSTSNVVATTVPSSRCSFFQYPQSSISLQHHCCIQVGKKYRSAKAQCSELRFYSAASLRHKVKPPLSNNSYFIPTWRLPWGSNGTATQQKKNRALNFH